MAERGFAVAPSDAALREVAATPPAPAAPPPAVRDLRELPWSSIDNAESKDLDQVEWAERADDGAVRVLVGIADVDALVPRGSAVDADAAHNATSVYAGADVFPMLPLALSADRTSLLEGEDRLAIVVELRVAADGTVERADVYRALLRNRAKLAYDDVGAWLERGGAPPESVARVPELSAQILLQYDAARRLQAERDRAGALDFETIEARPVTKGGAVVGLAVVHKNAARELIEDFMIAANVAIARFLEAHGSSGIRRVVREPERWARIVEIARRYGDALPDAPDSRALAAFLARRRAADPLRFPDLSLSIVKLMGPGEYALDRPGHDPGGHFGLAAEDYSHATAPNRRYADLVTQRLVKAVLAGAPQPYTDDELGSLAAHCTEREDAARAVERTVRKTAAALLLASRIGDTFDAIVTGAARKGTFVRLLDPPAEGRVVRGEAGMDVGERVRVRLLSVDPERGYVDFEGTEG
ncbi:RNB domain-containing ribonuclease [Gemmatirosa kalamazoonensis]|uniref:RNB domain-containing ribonuclease n=1 Tax=Gemmatirosa kalamazoonensis TaxID=861299 RepID=UPI003CCD1F42